MKKRGITLIESMVAIFLFGVISIPLYYILSDMNYKRAVIECKDFAKQEANKVIKVVENDLSQARKGSFKQVSEDVIKIKVREKGDSNENVDLEYLFIKPKLFRTVGKKRFLISKNVELFEVSKTPEEGRLVLSLKTFAAFDGIKQNEPIEYSQEKLIVMREDSSDEYDPYWCDVGLQDNFFATKGSVIAGLKEDAEAIIQNFTNEWGSALGDIKNMTIGELTKVKDDLLKVLKNTEKSLKNIDKDVMGLGVEAFFDIKFLDPYKKKKRKAANKIKTTLAEMKTKGSLDWEKVKACGQNINMWGTDMKEDAIRGFFDAKVEVFNSGQEVVKQLDELKKQAAGIGGDIDVSTGIDRHKWGL